MSSLLVNDPFLALRPYVPGKPISETKRELGLTDCVKLASNENPLGAAPKAVLAAHAALVEVQDYPDGSAFYLKGALAGHLGVSPEELIVANGTNEIIEMTVRTFVRPGEHMLYAAHSFVIYKLCAQAAGVPIVTVPFRELRVDLGALAQACTEKTKLVFLDNPNNPTGSYFTRSELDTFLRDVPANLVVVLDEAYREYVTASDYPDGLHCARTRPRTMLMRTFSKCYGLAGLRVGYAVAAPALIDFLNRGRQPFNVSSVGQAAATAALQDVEHVQRSVQLNRQQMARMLKAYAELGLPARPSQTNFILVDFARDADLVFQALLRLGVIIRPMGAYGLPTHARITIGTEAQNDKLLSALAELR